MQQKCKCTHSHTYFTLYQRTHTNSHTVKKNNKTDSQEFSRSILGRWQSLYSSIRSSNLGLCPGSEVSSLSWHAKAPWPIRPCLRDGREVRKTKLTVLQCQVSIQIAIHLARDNKDGKKLEKWKTKTEVLDDNLEGNSLGIATVVTSFSVTHSSRYKLSLRMPLLLLTYTVHREGISSNLGQLKAN